MAGVLGEDSPCGRAPRRYFQQTVRPASLQRHGGPAADRACVRACQLEAA